MRRVGEPDRAQLLDEQPRRARAVPACSATARARGRTGCRCGRSAAAGRARRARAPRRAPRCTARAGRHAAAMVACRGCGRSATSACCRPQLLAELRGGRRRARDRRALPPAVAPPRDVQDAARRDARRAAGSPTSTARRSARRPTCATTSTPAGVEQARAGVPRARRGDRADALAALAAELEHGPRTALLCLEEDPARLPPARAVRGAAPSACRALDGRRPLVVQQEAGGVEHAPLAQPVEPRRRLARRSPTRRPPRCRPARAGRCARARRSPGAATRGRRRCAAAGPRAPSSRPRILARAPLRARRAGGSARRRARPSSRAVRAPAPVAPCALLYPLTGFRLDGRGSRSSRASIRGLSMSTRRRRSPASIDSSPPSITSVAWSVAQRDRRACAARAGRRGPGSGRRARSARRRGPGRAATVSRLSPPATSGGQQPPCGASGVNTNPLPPGASTGPPAASVYALEPSGVATTSPSPAKRMNSSPSTRDLGRDLAGAVAHDDEVVDAGPAVSAPSDVDRERGQPARRPVAGGDAVERVGEVVGGDRGQRAEAAAGDAEHGPAAPRAPVRSAASVVPSPPSATISVAVRRVARLGDRRAPGRRPAPARRRRRARRSSAAACRARGRSRAAGGRRVRAGSAAADHVPRPYLALACVVRRIAHLATGALALPAVATRRPSGRRPVQAVRSVTPPRQTLSSPGT